MVTESTKRVLLTNLINKRDELIRLKSSYETLKELIKSLSYEVLTEKEKKFLNLVKSGKLKKEILKETRYLNTSYLFPFAEWLRSSWCRREIGKEDLNILRTLSIPIEDDIKPFRSHSDELLCVSLNQFLVFDYESNPIPRLFEEGSFISPKSLLGLKEMVDKKYYEEILETIRVYARNLYESVYILLEVKKFLDREDITLDYIKKNFKEFYNTYYENGGENNN